MVLGARLRTVMSSIIRWRKAEILPAGGIEYAEGLLSLMRATVMENARRTPPWRQPESGRCNHSQVVATERHEAG